MTDNQTPQPAQPTEPDKGNGQNVPNTPKKRRGHFASDGISPRHAAPASPRSTTSERVPVAEPAAAESADAAPPQPAASNRFGAGDRKPASSKQSKQPAGSAPVQVKPVHLPIDVAFERTRLLFLAAVMVPLCIWASFPSWEAMVYEWYHTDDYSHGFLVIPATILFLYMRLETYPGTRYKLDWVGLFPIVLYGVFRIFAGIRYMDPLDAFAIWFWILGVVWFFYGWRVFLWALPSLCFLIFMFQLPWRIDVLMKNHLQLFAAQFAAVLLQIAGEAAVPIKNTIRLSTMELGVEQACSGLRFLMSVFAIAFATVLLLRRPWWQNVLILFIAAPLALFVNAVRIAITGILLERHYEMVAGWTAEGQNVGVVADGFAGKIAIALALGLFALFVWYLGKIFRRVEI
jgi:exosortase